MLRPLDEPYRGRAAQPGTPQHASWLFAARHARDALLGTFALMAEWRALIDPGTESAVAHLKLAWWREEIGRLSSGSPLHPITLYIAALPGAPGADVAALRGTLDAAGAQVAGAPLERGDDLQQHAGALYGTPLLCAASLTGADPLRLQRCVTALATAQYLARAVCGYRREARAGRIPFAVDELLTAGIENDDLLAVEPPPRLRTHLDALRVRADGYFATAADALPLSERGTQRHLLVLAALGRKQLQRRRDPAVPDFRLGDLYNAWNTARRAAAAR
jgi:phytoene synthase